MKVMLCGASDLNDILPLFKGVASNMGFQPLNYLSGEIYYHQYGENNWTANSTLTVANADILVFVINSNYGKITWKDELPKTIEEGKNFLVLCRKGTYDLYLQVKSGSVKPANQETLDLISQIEELECAFQITIVPYNDYADFSLILKNQINGMFLNALRALQQKNQKATILPILKQTVNTKTNNPIQIKIAKEILFDVFEQKELRKRSLSFLSAHHALNDDEITQLFTDVESGISRKAVEELFLLVKGDHDLDYIFSKVIECCSESEVGFVRRAIKSLIEIDTALAIKYLCDLFPVQDVGTPRRIVTYLDERKDNIKKMCNTDLELKSSIKNLMSLCLGFKTEGKDWKELAQKLIIDIDNSINP